MDHAADLVHKLAKLSKANIPQYRPNKLVQYFKVKDIFAFYTSFHDSFTEFILLTSRTIHFYLRRNCFICAVFRKSNFQNWVVDLSVHLGNRSEFSFLS